MQGERVLQAAVGTGGPGAGSPSQNGCPLFKDGKRWASWVREERAPWPYGPQDGLATVSQHLHIV